MSIATRLPERSALRAVLTHRLYRGATISMLLSGIAVSAAAPQIATFLVTELHASLTAAGLFYLTNLLAPVAGYVVGSRSDRSGNRLGLFRWCAVAGFVGWTAIAWSPVVWMPYVISALVLGFAGAAGSQVFAALHDALQAEASPNPEGVVSIVRMAVTAGWIIGPTLGAFGAAAFGIRPMLFATALCSLAQIIPMGFRADPAPRRGTEPDTGTDAPRPHPARAATVREMMPLFGFTVLYVFVYAGESVKYAFLPLYMQEDLRFSPALSGTVIGIQPLVELALMPLAAVVARRVGAVPLMVVGALFGVGANMLFAFSGTATGLLAGQVLMGGVWGVFAGLGILVAQRLLPHAVATASAVFMSSTAVSQALGGTLGGLGAGLIGLPHVFVVPAALAFVAAVGLGFTARRDRRRRPSGS